MKVKRKVSEIDAVQYQGDYRVLDDLGEAEADIKLNLRTNMLEIETHVGLMQVGIGDWVLKGAGGDLFVVEKDDFPDKYEPIEP